MTPHLDQPASGQSRATTQAGRSRASEARQGTPANGTSTERRADRGDRSTSSGRPHGAAAPGVGVGPTLVFLVLIAVVVVVVALL